MGLGFETKYKGELKTAVPSFKLFREHTIINTYTIVAPHIDTDLVFHNYGPNKDQVRVLK